MRQKIIILLVLVSILLTGCSDVQNGNTIREETQGEEIFITYEDSKKITDKLSMAFDGFDCNIFVNNSDTGVDFSLSMRCHIIKSSFADFVVWFASDVQELAEEFAVPISNVEVTFYDDISNDIITWVSLDCKTGKLYDLTNNPSVIESVSPLEIIKMYGSTGLEFPMNE